MKWLHVLGHLRSGGVELRLMWTIEGLGTDHEHSIVSMDGSLDVLERFPGVRKRLRVFTPPTAVGASLFQRNRWINRLVQGEEPDALLSYGWGAFDAVLWSVISRSRIPCFHHEDGFTAEEVRHMPRRRVLVRRLALPRITATLVPSTTLATMARDDWRIPAHRIVHVPNGIPRARSMERVDLHARFGIPEGTPICVTAGRLERVKRVDRAIDAAEAAGLPLVVLGDGPERERLGKHAQGTGARTHFAGQADDVRPYFRGADVYLSLSCSEQHPLAMLEAMDEGLPVVATDVGDVARSLPPGQQRFLVSSANPVASAVACLRELGAERGLRDSVGRANMPHVEEKFRFEAALAAVRHGILSRCHPPGFSRA